MGRRGLVKKSVTDTKKSFPPIFPSKRRGNGEKKRLSLHRNRVVL